MRLVDQTVLFCTSCRDVPPKWQTFWPPRGLAEEIEFFIMLGNVVPLWETMLAAMKLGAVIIPATTLLESDELKDRAGARQS